MAWRRRRRARRTIAGRLLDYVTLVLLVSALLYVAAHVPGLDLAGGARAVDGDSLEVDGVEIRLFGIDAPEALQTCQDGAGTQWNCGRDAARTLRQLIGKGEIACRAHEEDAYGRAVARCAAGDMDLGAEMVRLGMAVVLIEGITQYAPQLAEARAARRGLWQGSFVEPADWRAGQPR